MPASALSEPDQGSRAATFVDGLAANADQFAGLLGCQSGTATFKKFKPVLGIAGDQGSQRIEQGNRRANSLSVAQDPGKRANIGRGNEGLEKAFSAGLGGDAVQRVERPSLECRAHRIGAQIDVEPNGGGQRASIGGASEEKVYPVDAGRGKNLVNRIAN